MIRGLLVFLLVVALYGWASERDYQDAVEMHEMVVSLYPEAAESITW